MRIVLIMITGGTLLGVAEPAGGQEVNSDVSIPIPGETVTTIPAVSGLFATPILAQDPAIQGILVDEALGNSSEDVARARLGDFMASLLIKAGIITVEPEPFRVGASGEKAEDGSRPAWTGRTPVSLSVSGRRLSQAMRQR